jgi:hypothetical protein
MAVRNAGPRFRVYAAGPLPLGESTVQQRCYLARDFGVDRFGIFSRGVSASPTGRKAQISSLTSTTPAQLLKPVEFSPLLLRLAQRRRRGKGFGSGLAPDSSCQTKVGAVARIVGSGAVATQFAALAGCGGDRAAAEIARRNKLAEPVGSLGVQLRHRLSRGYALQFLAYI